LLCFCGSGPTESGCWGPWGGKDSCEKRVACNFKKGPIKKKGWKKGDPVKWGDREEERAVWEAV